MNARSPQSLEVAGRRIGLDNNGHLADPGDWSEAVGRELAAADGIELGSDHWWLIRFVRDYHERYGMPPLMRIVVAELAAQRGPDTASSRFLYRLFPDGPIRLACKYAGLPEPDSCI